ncbi:hypothetical protein BH10BAC5_BH10BAC5_20270 [soil metagenome]
MRNVSVTLLFIVLFFTSSVFAAVLHSDLSSDNSSTKNLFIKGTKELKRASGTGNFDFSKKKDPVSKDQKIDVDAKSKELNVDKNDLNTILSQIRTETGDPGDSLSPEAISQQTITGYGTGDYFGYSVSAAGDVNGDGFADIIVGAYGYNSNTGRIYLYLGSASGIITTPAAVITGGGGTYFGYSISTAGDVNGDGYSDIIIGAIGYNTGTGKVYLYLGTFYGINPTPAVILTGEAINNSFGSSVSGAGDVNGDGYSDIIVGAKGYSSNTGRAYLYHGNSTGINTTPTTTLTGEAVSNYFGYSVSDVGDLNNDGYSDIIVGAYGYSSSTGRAYIYFGGPIMDNTADVILNGSAAGDQFGYSVSDAGDVNGDDYSDIIVGANGYFFGTGRAYIFIGSSSGLNSTPAATITGEATSNNFGNSVSGAGDVNGDGYSDIVVGAVGYSSSKGRAYLYRGSSSGINSTPAKIFTGEASTNFFGVSVSGAVDVNGDGYSDFIVGAYYYNSGVGRIYLYTNSMSGYDIPDHVLNGESNSSFGISVSSAGDVNGDGYSDIIVGAYTYSSSTGRAYIYLGTSSGINTTPAATLTGEAANNYFGISVSGAGDVNGDGFSDVIVGANGYSTSTGRAYLYHGNSTGINTTPATILTGAAVSNYFGYSVSNAGDMNNDGYSDIIVGAYGYSSSTGRAYIYIGTSSGLNSTPAATITGEGISNNFGISVSGAGDVNGDDYSDIIVGASGYSSSTGRAYLYLGTPYTVNTTPTITLTGEAANNNFGVSVSDAGDINKDGYSDIIVGANGFSNSTGKTYLYLGILSGINSVTAATFTGGAVFDNFGYSISGAGDVNGDGYSDIIVGASGYSSNTGRAYIYFGGSTIDNVPDIILKGENINNYFGHSVALIGDINRDGLNDVFVGAPAYNSNTGRAYIYLSTPTAVKPSLLTVKDIPNDQGGKVMLKWTRSAYQETGLVTGYDVYRSPKPQNGVYAWQLLINIPSNISRIYSLNADTYSDSVAAGIQRTYFKIVARTSVLSQYWTSNIQSGYSIDNLAPATPINLAASPTSSTINLNWDDAYAPDVSHYKIFRNGSEFTTSTISQFSDNSVNANSSYTFNVSAVDIHGNESPLSSAVISSIAIKLSMKIFLGGAYSGGVMISDLLSGGVLPLTSPYGTTETVTNTFLSAHTNIIDWLKLDLRQTESGSTVSSRSVFLLSDGSLLDTNGTPFCTFYGIGAGNYYVVVKHRNHLSVMTSGFVVLTTISLNYDFTTGLNKFYGGDAKNLGGGIFGIYSGDGNQDGSIDNFDRNIVWRPNNGQSGYLGADFNLDGSVDNIDKNLKWRPNNGKGTYVP